MTKATKTAVKKATKPRISTAKKRTKGGNVPEKGQEYAQNLTHLKGILITNIAMAPGKIVIDYANGEQWTVNTKNSVHVMDITWLFLRDGSGIDLTTGNLHYTPKTTESGERIQ